MRLFHMTSEREFRLAKTAGEYRPAAFDREGFIHCSYAWQIERVAGRIFRGATDLVLLEIDPGRLTATVVEENLEGGVEQFPHIYGPLPLTAIVGTHPFPCRADGGFDLPPVLKGGQGQV